MSISVNHVTDTQTPSTGAFSVVGNLKLTTAGNKLFIKEGSNATMGQVSLVGGTATVSTTAATANSRVFITCDGGTITNLGVQYVTITPGTGFTITSVNILDASTVSWLLLDAA